MGGRAPSTARSQPDTPGEGPRYLTPDQVRALPAMVSVAQAAAALGYGTRTLYDYIALGMLPEGLEPLRIRGHYRFRLADIMRFLRMDA